MANVNLLSAYDMSNFIIAEADYSYASSHSIEVHYGVYTDFYYGNFSYSSYGYLSGGTVSSYELHRNGVGIYEISNGAFSATKIMSYLSNYNHIALYNYVLGGNDTLNGSTGDDVLYGYGGNDYIDGNSGADRMYGGAGNDIYVVENAGDLVYENASAGTDLVLSSRDYTLTANVENLTLTGNAISGAGNTLNNFLTGNAENNVLSGDAGSDTLDGGAGADQLIGGLGNDTYIVDNVGDVVTENTSGAAGGLDTVKSSVDYTLDVNLENLILTGVSPVNGTGNDLANTITGNSANNILDGKEGADILVGGIGDDTYIVDILKTSKGALALQDKITELPNQGNDTLQLRAVTNLNYPVVPTVVLALNFENLDATSVHADNKINLTGNSVANILTGNGADNILNGGAGADTLIGGGGNDTYILDDVGDVVTENGSDLHDKVVIAYKNTGVAVTLDLANYANVEDLTITGTGLYNVNGTSGNNILVGNGSANTLSGGDGDDTLDGMGGIDILIGGNGDDTYIIDNLGDIITEVGADANDTVVIKIAKGHFSVSSYAGIEHLTLTGSAAQNLTGDGGINILTGNGGANVIDGGGGADQLIGGAGNDTYKVYGQSETIIELLNGGTDTVISTDTLTLAANLENLMLVGASDIDATGNSLNNVLTGNAFNNILDGKEGVDTLIGGLGNDTYIVDIIRTSRGALALQDIVREILNQGDDTLQLRASSNLNIAAIPTVILALNIENLDATLVDSSNKINLTGNTLNNTITGNDADNILNGGAGADTLIGGGGNDIYIFDNAGDTAIETSGQGIDTVRIAYKNITSIPVTILMSDMVYDHIENLTVTGTGLFNVTGNDLDNYLIGNASANTLIGGLGNDILDGGIGKDILDGGDGDDIYIIDSLGDTIIDSSGTQDTVYVNIASGTYVLPSSIEWAKLLGIKNINLTGNDGRNYLEGNSGANIINGGLEADLMIGGKGNDTYYVDNAGDAVVEDFSGGVDTIVTSINLSLLGHAYVENLTLIGDAVTGTGNTLNNIITGNDKDNVLDGKGGLDTLRGGLGNDLYHVDFIKSGSQYKLAAVVTESVGQGDDTIRLRDDAGLVMTSYVTLAVGANIENFDILDTRSLLLNLTGNALNNFLVGNQTANILNGGAGHDKLWGAGGADTLIGGAGNDRFYYVSGAIESSLGAMDVIKDFTTGDKITFEGASGLSYYGAYSIDFVNAQAGVNIINADTSIDDKAVFFRAGNNGYLYIKGVGDGFGNNFDGTLIMVEKKITGFSASDIEFNAVFESEGGNPTAFSMEDKVIGSLSAYTDKDAYSFSLDAPGVIELDFDIPTSFYASQPAYKVQLLNSHGVEIGEWSLGSDRKISVPLSSSGDYSIVVNGVSSTKFSADPYSFTVKQGSISDVVVDDSPLTASLAEGQSHMYKVVLDAGAVYSFNALSVETLKGFDPKLRIYDESGRQLMVSDDTALRYTRYNGVEIDGNTVDAHAAFIAPASGTYYIAVEGAYAPANPIKYDMVDGYRDGMHYVNYKSDYAAAGSYSFQVVKHDLHELITAQVAGGSYNEFADLGNPISITFGFPTAFPSEFPTSGYGSIYPHGYVAGSFRGFSEAQKAEIREVMDYWETITGIDFVEETNDPTTAQIKFGWMKNTNGAGGSAYGFDDQGGGPYYYVDETYYLKGQTTVILNSVSANPQSTNIGTAAFWNLINHELGHAIGFEHPETYTHFADYQQLNVLPAGFDSLKFSVMSYIGDMGMTIMPTTVQLFDIAAAQHLYGANMNYKSGNTDWEFNEANKEYYMTIWDGGGEDTIDTSGQMLGSIIYLQAGASSSIGQIGKFSDVSATDLLKAVIPGEFGDRAYNNVTIAFNVQIENAKGGAGDDVIVGNALNNKLWGGAGSDVLKGGDGNDRLDGGAGHDMLYGGAGEDIFVFEGPFDANSSDLIGDFDAGDDTIHLSGILEGFDPLSSAISDFVSIVTDGSNSNLFVDIDGAGTGHGMALLAVLKDVAGQDADTLYSNGHLTVA